MIKFLIICIFLAVSPFVHSIEKVHFSFQSSKIKQGSIVDARIVFDAQSVQRLNLSKLKNTNFSEYFYIYEAELPLRKVGENSIGSDAKIIVLKIPSSQPAFHTIDNEKIEITWNNIEFVPTEAGKGFVFGDFEIQGKRDIFFIIMATLGVVFVTLTGWRFYRKIQKKKIAKKKKEQFKKDIMSAVSYDEVVGIWQKKLFFVAEFPHLENHFKNLEIVLFKYQFKLIQTENEKNIVMAAYREFVEQIKGGFNGV